MEQWETVATLLSSDTNVKKYVFRRPTAVAEAVLYRYGDYLARTVICCSTQSGCPIGCRFCGSGDFFVRSLTAEEIVSQVEHLMVDNSIDGPQIARFQIMFMAMGEPLLNLKNLARAIDDLHARYPNAALLISTSAPRIDYEQVVALSQRYPTIGLQFSVHESTDRARDNLIPFQSKLSLSEIAQTGMKWHVATGRRPFFNYCAHASNSTVEDADRLLRLFDPTIWEATISVVCEPEENGAIANARQRSFAERFTSLMVQRGFSTRMFDPAGQDDIGGGCGQLWATQRWFKENPALARPSAGRGLPIVHSPREN